MKTFTATMMCLTDVHELFRAGFVTDFSLKHKGMSLDDPLVILQDNKALCPNQPYITCYALQWLV